MTYQTDFILQSEILETVFSTQVLCSTEEIQVYTDQDSYLEPHRYEPASLWATKQGEILGQCVTNRSKCGTKCVEIYA